MKQIINGLLYDTDKATLISTIVIYGGKRRDYYKTDKGNYFCHYAYNGELRVVSESEIKKILAKYDVEAYIHLFGSVKEG